MQIFAYTTDPDFRELVNLECREIAGHQPVIHQSFDELKNMFEVVQTIDLLIVDFPDDLTNSTKIRDFILSFKKSIKDVLVLGHDNNFTENTKSFSRMAVSELFEQMKVICGQGKLVQSDWTTVPITTLVHFNSVPFDLYIKLSSERFVKRFPAHEEINRAQIDALIEKGISDLYCEKKFNRDFSMMLINNMINKLDKQYSSIKFKLDAFGEVFETTREIIQNLGITGRVIEVCDSAIESLVSIISQEKDEFSEFLSHLKDDKKLAFQFKLINLTNYIGCQLINDMGMENPSDQVNKFVFASFFCDMHLKNQKLHFFRTADEVSTLKDVDQKTVLVHAIKAADLISKYKNAPQDVAKIITQHHGSFTGIGLPNEKSSQLLPLSKVLIVAQDLAFCILLDMDTPALEVMRNQIKQNKYPSLSNLLECLERNLDNSKS
jgi:hypothetical protein